MNSPKKLTVEDIRALIEDEQYHLHDRTTVCVLTTTSGFIVVSDTTAARPGEFSEEKGRQYALDLAIEKLWPFEVYAQGRMSEIDSAVFCDRLVPYDGPKEGSNPHETHLRYESVPKGRLRERAEAAMFMLESMGWSFSEDEHQWLTPKPPVGIKTIEEEAEHYDVPMRFAMLRAFLLGQLAQLKTANKIKRVVERLKSHIAGDPELAWAWHCNIAGPLEMALHISPFKANMAAERLMRHLFDVDIWAMFPDRKPAPPEQEDEGLTDDLASIATLEKSRQDSISQAWADMVRTGQGTFVLSAEDLGLHPTPKGRSRMAEFIRGRLAMLKADKDEAKADEKAERAEAESAENEDEASRFFSAGDQWTASDLDLCKREGIDPLEINRIMAGNLPKGLQEEIAAEVNKPSRGPISISADRNVVTDGNGRVVSHAGGFLVGDVVTHSLYPVQGEATLVKAQPNIGPEWFDVEGPMVPRGTCWNTSYCTLVRRPNPVPAPEGSIQASIEMFGDDAPRRSVRAAMDSFVTALKGADFDVPSPAEVNATRDEPGEVGIYSRTTAQGIKTEFVDEKGIRTEHRAPGRPGWGAEQVEKKAVYQVNVDTLKAQGFTVHSDGMKAGVVRIKPTIGRRVWFYPSMGVWSPSWPLMYSDTPHMDAGIVYVHTDGTINLDACDHQGNHMSVQRVTILMPDDARPDPMPANGYARWMPYQAGQAK